MHRQDSTIRLPLNLLLLSFFYLRIADAAAIYDDNLKNLNIPESCKNLNETEAAKKLNQICEDCYDLFQIDKIRESCRTRCYSGVYLPACVQVLCYWDEKDLYRTWVEKLSGNRFAVWNENKVELVNDHSAITQAPVVHHSIKTRSTSDYCQSK